MAGSVFAFISSEERTWDQADDMCSAMGFTLATIKDTNTNQAIYNAANRFSSEKFAVSQFGITTGCGDRKAAIIFAFFRKLFSVISQLLLLLLETRLCIL